MAKKRHHYIPEFYLKGFVDPNNKPYIWVYDKDDGKIIKSTSKNIAVEEHYFSFVNEAGKKDSETIENMMADIESEASAMFRKIRTYTPLTELTRDEKYTFVAFVAFMMVRVPNFRVNIENAFGGLLKKTNIIMASNKKGFESMVRQYEKKTGSKINMLVEELRQFVLDGEYDISVDSQFSLMTGLSIVERMTNVFFNMKWQFFKACRDYKFLSGDNPLFYYNPKREPGFFRGDGLMNKNIEVTFPISKDLAALGSWKGREGYIEATNQEVKAINRRTVTSALKFIFASEKSDTLKKFVTKYKGTSPKIIVR